MPVYFGAVALPILQIGEEALVRLTEVRMEALAEALKATAEEIRAASGASGMFKKRA